MTSHTVTFRRVALTAAAQTLQAVDLRVLLVLAATACPRTARAWTTPLRLAEELALAPTIVDAALTSLESRSHLSLFSRGHGALRCYELGPVFVRALPDPPENLPVAPSP